MPFSSEVAFDWLFVSLQGIWQQGSWFKVLEIQTFNISFVFLVSALTFTRGMSVN